MLLVTNRSGKELVIADLGLSISPKQAFDLDAIKLKTKPDNSKDLQLCIKRGWITVLKSDRKKKRKAEMIATKFNIDEKTINDLKETLKGEIRQQLSTISITKQTDDAKMDQILSVLGKISQQGQTVSNDVIRDVIIKQNNASDEAVSIDEDTLNEIHARAINRLAQGTSSEIRYKEKQLPSNISYQASELEDLIG